MAKTARSDTTAGLLRKPDGIYAHGTRFTLGAISRGTGITRPHVTRIFNGQRKPTIKTAEKIAGFMGVSMDTLVGFLRRV